jgi:amidohydrolase
MSLPSDDLARLAAELAPQMVDVRRDLHQHPELGWHETRTTERLATALRGLGLEPRVRSTGTGLVVEVGAGGPVVGFRADIDALALQEEASPPYRSVVPGVMHACGHDAHAAIGVGIAAVLDRLGVEGRVRFIFQPAEEQLPSGAMALVDEGVHEGLASILAFHIDPSLAAGKIGVRTGGITSASDRFAITLHGPGGHTSRPHQTVDLLYAAGRVVTNVPLLIRHGIDPRETVLVVFGHIHGGTADNVIPTTVTLGGTIRLFDLELWRAMPKLLEGVVSDLVRPLGAVIDIDYEHGAPPVVNHPDVVDVVAQAGRALLGDDNVASTHQSLGSEDFACYLEQVPGALIRLGAALPDRMVDLHSAGFDIDEAAIEVGMRVGAGALIELLSAARRA